MLFLGTFLTGFATCAFLACTLFFVRFWRASRDPFFLSFALAFGLFAAERIVGGTVAVLRGNDHVYLDSVRSWIYLFRLAAYLVLLYAIVQKNRPRRRH